MNKRWFAALSAALLCLGVSLSAGWLWQTMANDKYEASARLLLGDGDGETGDDSDENEQRQSDETRVLSPEVMAAAAALLHDRGIRLSLSSPFDPVTDYLLSQSRVSWPEHGQPGEICIRCSAAEAEEAVQMLQAIVDAYLAAGSSEPARESGATAGEGQFELDLEREQLRQAIDRQEQAIGDLARRLELKKDTANRPDDGSVASLEVELGRIQEAHREATARLGEARRDFDNKLPPESVAARLANLPARTQVLERLNVTKVRDELRRYEGLQQKWSSVYGRNHPRMVEIRERIEALEGRLADVRGGGAGDEGESGGASPTAIVLAAFESESASLEQAEHQVLTRLSDFQERVQGQQELELKLGEARKELAFLHAECDRVQKQMAPVQPGRAAAPVSVLSPAALDREPIGPQTGLPMAVCCVAGMALYLLLLWQIRARWLAADQREARPDPRGTPARRERFKSREEEQLMRLKLAARGS